MPDLIRRAASLGVVALTVVGLCTACGLGALSQDRDEIRTVVARAIQLGMEIPALAGNEDPSGFGLSWEEWYANARAQLSATFTGTVLSRYLANARANPLGLKIEARDDHAGADSIEVTSITVTGNTATASATAWEWASDCGEDPDTTPGCTSPRGKSYYTLSLTHDSGFWLVDGEHMEFAPGSGP